MILFCIIINLITIKNRREENNVRGREMMGVLGWRSERGREKARVGGYRKTQKDKLIMCQG